MRLLPILAAAMLSHAETVSIEKLSFLAGCWAGGGVEEMWMKPQGGTMLGIGRTIKGGKTVSTEFLQISAAPDGTLVLNAQLRLAAKSTPFRLTELKDGIATFSNPEHDYPQQITYRREPDGSLSARTEGTIGGKTRNHDFKYARARCSD